MTYTVYEYDAVTCAGEPIQPPTERRVGQATGAAVQLGGETIYVAIVADADMYLRSSAAGDAASAADHKLLAGETYGFPVKRLARPYIYGVAA